MIYVIDIEDTGRYSEKWREWYQNILGDSATLIQGEQFSGLTPGGFFDFNRTNKYKAEQTIHLSNLFAEGKITNDDVFIFLDIWHPGVISLKYMITLGDYDCKIYGYLHAGSYDKTDILGIKGVDKWADGFEDSIFRCCEEVWVASDYHRRLVDSKRYGKFVQVPFPYDFSFLDEYKTDDKENIIVFPHRISPDKQPEIVKDLEQYFPDFSFRYTQEERLSKDDYYKLLAKSKYVISVSLHENWGISIFEAMYLGCVPILPSRCSYVEMYPGLIKYDSRFTESSEDYNRYKNYFVQFIKQFMLLQPNIDEANKFLQEKYCSKSNIERFIKDENL